MTGVQFSMKTTIVDCTRSKNVKDLVDAVSRHSEYNIVRFENVGLDFESDKSVDALVISGSGHRSADQKDRDKFQNITDLIKRFDRPVLGVCFAHQLIGHAYGARLSTLAKPVYDKFEQVRIIEPDEIFNNYESGDTIPLVEYHNDYVMKQGLPEAGFTILADSKTCEVEAIKYNAKPLYGVQFHAERYRIRREEHREGLKIFDNFYRLVVKR